MQSCPATLVQEPHVEPEWFEECFDNTYIELDRLFHPPRLNSIQAEQLIRLLDMKRSERWLDICCGYGRYLLPLVEKGYRITGIDASYAMLRGLESAALQKGLVINANRGDMRWISFTNYFHGAFLAGTSFGVFEAHEDDARALESIRDSLVPGGKFLIDQINPSRLFQEGSSGQKVVRLPGQTIYEDVAMDPDGDCYTIHRKLHRGSWQREWVMRFRYYDLRRLTETLMERGLHPVQFYGDLSGAPYRPDSPRLVVLSLREK